MSSFASLALLALLSLPALAEPGTSDAMAKPESSDMAALIECRGELAQFRALAPALEDPLEAVAMGWRPLPQANLFLTEFVLTAPITVFGQTTDHIAFAGESVLAIIDLPDPRPLARQLELETGIDTPAKAMFGKEVRTVEVADPQTGETLIESMVLAVSNVDSHPGKTLVGCSYSVDRIDPEPPEPVPAVDTVVP
jgi:hypothetical protein